MPVKDSTRSEVARQYETLGYHVIAVHGIRKNGTCLCMAGANCRSAGKHPVAQDWQKSARPAAADIERMWKNRPTDNVGIVTGVASGFFVLDIDPDNDGAAAMAALVAEHGSLPTTYCVRTGSGGWHYYFAMPDFEIANSAGLVGKGIDIRATGGQVVAPPSVSGKGPYALLADVPVVPAPQWLLDRLRRPEPIVVPATVAALPLRDTTPWERAVVEGELKRLTDLGPEAGWDNTTFSVACNLIELANSPKTAITIPEAHSQFHEHCPPVEPGYDPAKKWASAMTKIGTKARILPANMHIKPAPLVVEKSTSPVPDDPTSRDCNDVGNAERLIDKFGKIIRYAADTEQWITYTGGVWLESGAEVRLETVCVDTIRASRKAEALLHSSESPGKKGNGQPIPSPRSDFYDWMAKSLMYTKLVAMRNTARSQRDVQVRMDAFDVDHMLLNCANTVVDLRNGDTIPHSPELMMMHQSPVDYDPGAQCPQWLAFLERVQPDPEMRDYLQRIAGYSITGMTGEQVIFVHNGPGATGKTTFLEVIKETLGDYGQKMDRETLLSKGGQSSGIPSDVARMAGARFLGASETAAGKKLDDERVKELVGGDTQSARHLYGKWFDFKPTGKVHMATNHLPGMESGGDALGRRLRIIPWDVIIPEGQRDKALKDKILATEGAGVLAWLVRGAQMWAESQGLVAPAIVAIKTAEHIYEADPLHAFIAEKLVLGGDNIMPFAAIYAAYKSWGDINGAWIMSGKAFSQALLERLGPDSRFREGGTGKSMFRVQVNFDAVPTGLEQYLSV